MITGLSEKTIGPNGIRGFTLMEIIGVMAIVSIMAAVIAPRIFDTITSAYGDAEAVNVQQLSENLKQYIIDNKRIPSQTTNDWVTALASYSSLARDNIEFNARGFRRAIYIDPRFFTGTDTVFTAYTQAGGLTQPPVFPRIMVVSDLAGNAPNPPTTNAAFSAIWDQTGGAGVVESDKVKIHRLHLASVFHRIVLVNSNPQQPGYALEAAAANAVPPASGAIDGSLTVYALHNSSINLFTDIFPSGSLSTVSMINSDQAYHYKTDGMNWFWESQ